VTDSLLTDSVDRALRELTTPDVLRSAEADGWSADLWGEVSAMGLPGISIEERLGGAGGSLADAIEVLRIAGRYALPLPLAEAGVLGGWLLTQAGIPVDTSVLTAVPGRPDDDLRLDGDRLSGHAHRVPWARSATRVVTLMTADQSTSIVVCDLHEVDVRPMPNLAGEPRDTVIFDQTPATVVAAPTGLTQGVFATRGALSRVALMAGALERVCEMTIEYTSQRRQFGKPVGSFQAVQQHLVHCAQQSSMVSLALQAASRAMTAGSGEFEVAAAKTLANQAATIATRAAHQAHGAMGMTQEYGLQHLTRRLWSWREEYGAERPWSHAIGAGVQRLGADLLYPLITSGSPVFSGDGVVDRA
jgi:acyl-CoA dehydrogenase